MMKVWVGPDGRTVATVGIEQALDYQLEAASSSADLSWSLASTAEWRGGYIIYNQQLGRYPHLSSTDELSALISCMDTACCGGEVAAANGGRVPKSGLGAAAADLVASINGTELDGAQWAGPGRG